MMKKSSNVMFVERVLLTSKDSMTTKIFTQEKNLINANIAQLALLVEERLVDMNEVI